ncbi:PAS domain-containing sensor histidine kinase [Glaciimonas immobilis]|uniref:PAS domain S-box-containing protein n=1 Tax=Glaciimonas immobilis TaxID=728004 RepID=A0A840RXC8_9BURK|nr:PAS domain-containing protein [Glaciimonas immobilis]KAF3996562.1 PAS domain-containing protein [Glaciimonas immobilis]MBB5201069.1 PAS domain S-box-containing protein [Glaciimonas immobilis]
MGINWRWIKVLWPLMVATALMLGCGYLSTNIMSSVRAYIGGEGLYSKNQKEAVLFLNQYAVSHNESDYRKFLGAIAVPLGNQDARLALEQPNGNLDAARSGFLAGGNHPDDIDGMISLFRIFRKVPYVSEIIAIWAEGDRYINALNLEAKRLHVSITSGNDDEEFLRSSLARIMHINTLLNPLEQEFSAKVGDASRKTQHLLLFVRLIIAALLMTCGCVISISILRKNDEFQKELLFNEERLWLAMRGTSDGLWDWDILRKCAYYSPRLMEILELGSEEAVHTENYFSQFIDPKYRDHVRTEMAKALHANSVYEIEFRLITRSGNLRWVRSRGQSALDAAGRPVRMVGALTDITERKDAELALHDSRTELRNLVEHQARAKEDERKRIAREIHDELGSMLTGIKAYVSVSIERAVSAGHAPEPLLVHATCLADEAMETVRRVIAELRPSVLDDLGIWVALEWYAGQIQDRSGLQCKFSISNRAAMVALDAERSIMLFRIVQEALTNVVRHAEASQMTIIVLHYKNIILVEIRDNGNGIETGQLLNGAAWGILGMHERARHFGAHLHVSGVSGLGTTVRLRLPLDGVTTE